ncbi:hypothetical protein ACFV2H_44585 [Streptomyces sp. NPDC059629]|uniref:hypothetical protein n=1 Tax=Streptomyces sp. NPDC059629 TaxID=3346889 RepID=UPI0036CF1FA4
MTSAERPHVALAWISRPKVQDLLERIGRDERLVTHDMTNGSLPRDSPWTPARKPTWNVG